ncbi:MAG TPA: biotin synthase BioB [Nitrospirae bacterium]|nr:biotin synthase BioB [Nitrospirota bacterium]
MSGLLTELKERVLNGGEISEAEASFLADGTVAPLYSLFEAATSVRERFRGNRVDLCSIVNAKSGNCTEDCAYCAQSTRHRTNISVYPWMGQGEIFRRAKDARLAGAKRFCIVTSGKRVSGEEIEVIASAVGEIRQIGLLPCATLGLLDEDELRILKDAGLERFHHNLETSEDFFPKVCTTHTYSDKIKTIMAVKNVGLSLCSGGIFGLGESWDDRIRMAFALKELNVDSVPINFLMPVKGTPMGHLPPLHPLEALRIISVYRFILPEKEIRLCGGRVQTLGELNSMVFLAGADGLLTGNYLTLKGRCTEDDIRLIEMLGLRYD